MKGQIENITPETAAEIAAKWMAVADTDGSGTIDFAEFSEFMTKLDPEGTESKDLEEVFNSIDKDGSKELD